MRVIRVLPYAACLLALSGAAACSGSGDPAAPAATTPGTVKHLEVTVKGTTITPAPAQVDLGVGQTLELVVTIDHDDELHAHGFEVEESLKSGVPTTLRLVGKQTGLFEVETHEPGLALLTVAVR